MLTHLLFSIAALIFMIILIITYFSYKKNTSSVRSKIYVCMIGLALVLTIVEIIEGITYVYNNEIVFSLMWKLHSIIMIAFVATLFYYLLAIENPKATIEELLLDNHHIFSLKNFFTISFVIITLSSIILVKTYPMGLTMFYFYTNQSITFLLVLYAIYIGYYMYIFYIKTQKNSFEVNDYITLIGTFILFVIALIIEYKYSEISIYSTLFTLVLILLYYFKENEDLLIIEELQSVQNNLNVSNEQKLNSLNELITDLEIPLEVFQSINHKLENSDSLGDKEFHESLASLNNVSNNFLNVLNSTSTNRFTKYRIDELVQNITEMMKPYIKQKNIEFTYDIDKKIPSFLAGDSVGIQRIIISLLMNAIHHTEVGRIAIKISGERDKDREIIGIKVSDTGMGIKKEDFDKVFMDNQEEDNIICNLALTKQYVESLEGQLYFDSYYGAGTTFYASIPQSIANEMPIEDVPIIKKEIEPKNCNNKRILLLDNEEYSSQKIISILKMYNLDITCINTGTEAINTMKCDEGYDLIIVTDHIEDMDYIKAGKLLKRLGNYVKVPPIIAFVVDNDNYHLDNVFDEYLPKPLNLNRLDAILKKRFLNGD